MYLVIDKDALEALQSDALYTSTTLDIAEEVAEENARAGYSVALIEVCETYRGKPQQDKETEYGLRAGYDFPFTL